MRIIFGRWTRDLLDNVIREASKIKAPGARINCLSEQFLGLDYKESTLTGDANTPEIYVINLEGVDCFTFIDYVEAMRLSGTFSEFLENLKSVRYSSGEVSFKNRNHFFADWVEFNPDFVYDVTEKIGGHKTRKVIKMLNQRKDRTYFLPGIQPRQREIRYIPSDAIDDSVIKKLKTGDYAGIYTNKEGLDVSHVGIIIRKAGTIYLRHASSHKKKVIDQNFIDYISGKPGLIILRPKNILRRL